MKIAKMRTDKTEGCEVAGCACKLHAKGLCLKHYTRLLRGRDPHTPSREELSLDEKFQAKRGPKDLVTGCIEWTGSRVPNGYGQIRRGEVLVLAHRLAWELKHGPIPEGMKVLHTCDNPPCCNEEHLFLGTDADNSADMVAKGRQARQKGEAHGNSKLTENDVLEIRRRLVAGESQRKIAVAFGVHHSTVGGIGRGAMWAHSSNAKPFNEPTT